MRIGYVLDSWPRLTEQFIAREIAYVAKRHDVRILALEKSEEGAAGAEATGLSSRVAFLPTIAGAGSWLDLAGRSITRPGRGLNAWTAAVRAHEESGLRRLPALERVGDEWAAWGVERIHAHFARWATAAAEVLSAAAGEVPYGFTAHAYDVFVAPVRLASKVNLARWAIACTQSAKRQIGAACGLDVADRVRVVRHGVDVEAYRPRETPRLPGPLRVLAVGRLVVKKGFDRLLDALSLLGLTGVAVEARLIGAGPEGERLWEQATRLSLVGSGRPLSFAPPCSPDDVRAAMRGWADVLVAPSVVAPDGDRDGIPNVVGEALACGLPVVGTTIGGLPEVVLDGKNGIIAAEGEATAIASAIDRLAGDASLRARLGEGARAIACERFDAAKNLAEFERVLVAGTIHV